ncbi:MAG: EamA family transporter [Eubacteriales bacterium]
MMFVSIAIIVLSNIFYHISQKSTPEAVNPFSTLFITYLTAIFLTLIGMFVYRQQDNTVQVFKGITWTSVVLGVAILGLEIGTLLMYRSGWQISVGALVANIALALLLIPIGIFLYQETLSLNKIIGIILCVVGLYFINR